MVFHNNFFFNFSSNNSIVGRGVEHICYKKECIHTNEKKKFTDKPLLLILLGIKLYQNEFQNRKYMYVRFCTFFPSHPSSPQLLLCSIFSSTRHVKAVCCKLHGSFFGCKWIHAIFTSSSSSFIFTFFKLLLTTTLTWLHDDDDGTNMYGRICSYMFNYVLISYSWVNV